MTQVFNATKAKTHFGEILMNSMKEPIIIEKNGKKVSVIISYKNYQKLIEQEEEEMAFINASSKVFAEEWNSKEDDEAHAHFQKYSKRKNK